MKAIVAHEYGGPEVLKYEEFPDPVAGPGEVLVRVAAASVNPADYKQRSGMMKDVFPIDFPGIIGLDLSGTIVAVGSEVQGFAVGDQLIEAAANEDQNLGRCRGTLADHWAIQNARHRAKGFSVCRRRHDDGRIEGLFRN